MEQITRVSLVTPIPPYTHTHHTMLATLGRHVGSFIPRTHISILGRMNQGKSTLMNCLTQQ
ncbi:hypothetical protein KIPB_014709, partial [Kipferlia bialata]|eukprot:g14709.t1